VLALLICFGAASILYWMVSKLIEWVLCVAEARSVVVTQPNNKLSRVLKAMLKELPGQMRAINAAGLASSLALSDTVAAVAGPAAADAAREELQRRLQLVRALQVMLRSTALTMCLLNTGCQSIQ